MAESPSSSLQSLEDRVAVLLNAEFTDAERAVGDITARHEAAEKKADDLASKLTQQQEDAKAKRENAAALREAVSASPNDTALKKAADDAEADVKAAELAIGETEAALKNAQTARENAARELVNAWRLVSAIGRQLKGLRSAILVTGVRPVRSFWGKVDFTFSAVLLLAVVTAAAFASIVCFTAAQFQGRMADYQVNGVPLSVWRLDQIISRKAEVEAKLQYRAEKMDLLEARQSSFYLDLADKKARVTAAALQYKQHLDALFSQARNLDATLASQLVIDKPIESTAAIRASEAIKRSPSLFKLMTDIDVEYGKLADAEYELNQAQAQIDGLTGRIEAEKEAASDGIAAIYEILGVSAGAADAVTTRERIENLISESEAFKGSSKMLRRVAAWPREVVILLLVLSMGVLGSALYMVSQFEEDYQQFTWAGKILRPGLGAVTALVLYIVVKAGILVVGDASRLGGNAPVNPYFIAFLAIIAGFMSENALAAIRTVGSSFLTRGADSSVQRRWVIADLTPNLAKAGKTVAQLAVHLAPLTVEEVAEIVTGKREVDMRGQSIIGAFLNTDPRGMFTDRAPAQ